jgi:citrate lyase subunit beta/citryl-CoA lyase
MRSMLFVPGDSRRKFDRALTVGADALILDLEDSVAEAAKDAARAETRAMLEAPRGAASRWVRVNALDTGRTLDDLTATMPAAPDGIVLPKCETPADVRTLACWLDAFERAHGLPAGATRIVIVATETAASLRALGDYRGCSERLAGMMWGAEDLAAAIGAPENPPARGLRSASRASSASSAPRPPASRRSTPSGSTSRTSTACARSRCRRAATASPRRR